MFKIVSYRSRADVGRNCGRKPRASARVVVARAFCFRLHPVTYVSHGDRCIVLCIDVFTYLLAVIVRVRVLAAARTFCVFAIVAPRGYLQP